MKKIKYNPERFDNEKDVLWAFFNHDFDSYKEYYDFLYPLSIHDKKLYEDEWHPLWDSSYHLAKQELEHIFRKREQITLEELESYMWWYWTDRTIKKSISLFLAIYYDYYKEDEDFNKDLYEATKQYFWINEEDIEKSRV